MKFLKNSLLTGFFVVVPVFVSIWVGWAIFDALTAWSVDFTDKIQFGVNMSPFWKVQLIRVLCLIVTLLALILIGALTRLALGQKLFTFMQRILMKVPSIKTIYSTCQQIGDAIWNAKGGNMFSKAVLFEYPRRGSWAVGFLTNENKEDFEITERLGRKLVSVFIPTTPNPTSGFLFLIPEEECIILKMSVADAMKYIVSCGGVIPRECAEELAADSRDGNDC